jgi:hypothetical protein
MAKSANPEKFTISAAELAKGLSISVDKLYKIIEFFDADSKDEWELKEEEHFVWLIKSRGTRLFSEFGAFAIAKYLDATQKQSPWAKFKELIFGHKAKLRNALVQKQIINNSESFLVRHGQGYISKKDAVKILVTSYTRFNKAFEDLKTSDMSMQIDKDFADIEGERYYSLTGLWRISQLLGKELKSKDRQAWCEAVAVAGPKVMKAILDHRAALESRVQAAKNAAKKRDKDRCQLTGQRSTAAKPIDIAGHHIFCRHHYPDLATSPDNIITLTEAVHRDFHGWNGGQQKSCTAQSLIEFLDLHYPNATEASIRLHHVRKIYAHLEPAKKREAVSTK